MAFKPPKDFSFSTPTAWPEWRQRFIRYRIAAKLDKEEGNVQDSTLLYAMGAKAEQIFSQFTFSGDENADDFNTVLGKLNDHFTPTRNVIHERATFYQRNYKDGESVEEYVRSLYELSQGAEFANKEENIRDRLVLGLNDRAFRKTSIAE